ncbi:jerky protein homolog-like [Venturia canescens]|uniref:jerky protein homolog-like n=1 Tax=Venturia canescens TaxID=32260 RepID=UPI001C9C5DAD|nr:jerky protein homolog-like [Venturia canescens]
MAETVKRRKSSDCGIQVEESTRVQSVSQSVPVLYSTKEPTVMKRNRYTFEEKKKILEESKKSTSQEICAKYALNDSILRRWKSNQNVIENAAKSSNTKILKKINKSNDLDAKLFTWLADCRRKGIPVSGPMLCQQALVINSRVGGSNSFKASHGWLAKWKKRNPVKNLKITGEKLSADEETANRYKQKFSELVAEKELKRAQVFNMDETGLMYKSTPKRTFVPADETQASGGKKQLERITIATCCNADGSFKLPLIFIGKSKNPHCLRNIDKNKLPVWYRNQTNAWMNLEIFEEWFKDIFVPKVEIFLSSKNLPKTAILLVDNCRSHRYIKVNDIEIHFFPPNVTSLIQPMDQGIIQTVKLHYEINLVNAVIEAQDENVRLIEFLKKVDLYKVIIWVADSWEKVKSSTIDRCWNNIWPKELKDASTQTDQSSLTLDNLDISVGTEVTFTPLSADDRDVNDLLNCLKKVRGYEEADAATILEWVRKTEKKDDIAEFHSSEVPSSMGEFGSIENYSPPVDHVMNQNDCQMNENTNFNYLSESLEILYESF